MLPRYSRDKATPWTARRLHHWSFAKGYFLNNSLFFVEGRGGIVGVEIVDKTTQ